MARNQKLYMISVTTAGIVCAAFCAVRSVPHFTLLGGGVWMYCFLLLLLLMILCRMLPIHIGAGRAMDISFVPVLAAAITSHYSIAVLLFLLSSFGSILKDPESRAFYYPFARSPLKECFNTFNVAVSMTLVGVLFDFASPAPAELLSVRMMLFSIGFALCVIFLNFLLFLFYFYLGDGRRFAQLVAKNIGGLLPNILSTVPLGLVLGLLLRAPQGYLFVALMMAPLLMARHSFKLYHDSHAMNMRTIASLCNAIDAKDHYTQGHSMRVACYSRSIAEGMQMPASFVEDVTRAALLHDVGKIGVNDAVLTKPGQLSDEEFGEIKRHPEIGHKIISSVRFSPAVNEGVLYHHLGYNMAGYPGSALPEGLPLSAAILAVADSYDAMTSDRPYRAGMEQERACAILREVAGSQLHPEVVDTFLRVLPTLDAEELAASPELRLEMLS